MKKLLLAGVLVGLMASGAYAGQFDITTLPGYEVVTTSPLNFGDTGWAGWSKKGKVVLGAKIISAGDSVSDFSVFRPFGPSATTPFGYTYGANEYGFIFRDVSNGAGNSGVKIELYFADPLAGYTISSKSGYNNFSGTGWAGWSAPVGDVVSGGGYEFVTASASPLSSQFADNGSVWPHYTFGATEQGWVVQNGGNGDIASQGRAYVISFDAPVATPDGGLTALLLGLSSLALAGVRRLVA